MAAERVTLCSLCTHTMRRTGEVTDEDERRRIEVQRSGKRQVTLGGRPHSPPAVQGGGVWGIWIGDWDWLQPLASNACSLAWGRAANPGLSLTSLKWNPNKGWPKKPGTDDAVTQATSRATRVSTRPTGLVCTASGYRPRVRHPSRGARLPTKLHSTVIAKGQACSTCVMRAADG